MLNIWKLFSLVILSLNIKKIYALLLQKMHYLYTYLLSNGNSQTWSWDFDEIDYYLIRNTSLEIIELPTTSTSNFLLT
jgi:hypothetical protein